MRVAPYVGVGVGGLLVGLVFGAVVGRGDAEASERFGRSVGDGDKADLEARLKRALSERDEALKARDALAAEMAPGTPGVDVGGALQKAQQELEALRAQAEAIRQQAAEAVAKAEQELASAKAALGDAVARGERAAAEATAAMQQRVAGLEREVADLRRQLADAQAESAKWRQQAQDTTTQIEALRREIATLKSLRGVGGG